MNREQLKRLIIDVILSVLIVLYIRKINKDFKRINFEMGEK